jgi:hypothetical protein
MPVRSASNLRDSFVLRFLGAATSAARLTQRGNCGKLNGCSARFFALRVSFECGEQACRDIAGGRFELLPVTKIIGNRKNR